jgi:hypothetical protein
MEGMESYINKLIDREIKSGKISEEDLEEYQIFLEEE